MRVTPSSFFNLSSLKLNRVEYSDPGKDWDYLPRLATNLKLLHLEAAEGMTDMALHSVLLENPLSLLEVSRNEVIFIYQSF